MADIKINFNESKVLAEAEKLYNNIKEEFKNPVETNIEIKAGDLDKLTEQMTKLNEVFGKIDFSKFNKIGESVTNVSKEMTNSGEIIVKNTENINKSFQSLEKVMSDLNNLGSFETFVERTGTGTDKLIAKVRTTSGEIQKLQYAIKDGLLKINEETGKVDNVKGYELISKDIINGQQIKQLETYRDELIKVKDASKGLKDEFALSTQSSVGLDSKIEQLNKYISMLEDGQKVEKLNMDNISSYLTNVADKTNNLIELNDKYIRQQKIVQDFQNDNKSIEDLEVKLSKSRNKSDDEFNKDIIQQEVNLLNEKDKVYEKLLTLQEKELRINQQIESSNDTVKKLDLEKQLLDVKQEQNSLNDKIKNEGLFDREYAIYLEYEKTELQELLENQKEERSRLEEIRQEELKLGEEQKQRISLYSQLLKLQDEQLQKDKQLKNTDNIEKQTLLEAELLRIKKESQSIGKRINESGLADEELTNYVANQKSLNAEILKEIDYAKIKSSLYDQIFNIQKKIFTNEDELTTAGKLRTEQLKEQNAVLDAQSKSKVESYRNDYGIDLTNQLKSAEEIHKLQLEKIETNKLDTENSAQEKKDLTDKVNLYKELFSLEEKEFNKHRQITTNNQDDILNRIKLERELLQIQTEKDNVFNKIAKDAKYIDEIELEKFNEQQKSNEQTLISIKNEQKKLTLVEQQIKLYKELSQLQDKEMTRNLQYVKTDDDIKKLEIEKQILDIRQKEKEIGIELNKQGLVDSEKNKEIINQRKGNNQLVSDVETKKLQNAHFDNQQQLVDEANKNLSLIERLQDKTLTLGDYEKLVVEDEITALKNRNDAILENITSYENLTAIIEKEKSIDNKFDAKKLDIENQQELQKILQEQNESYKESKILIDNIYNKTIELQNTDEKRVKTIAELNKELDNSTYKLGNSLSKVSPSQFNQLNEYATGKDEFYNLSSAKKTDIEAEQKENALIKQREDAYKELLSLTKQQCDAFDKSITDNKVDLEYYRNKVELLGEMILKQKEYIEQNKLTDDKLASEVKDYKNGRTDIYDKNVEKDELKQSESIYKNIDDLNAKILDLKTKIETSDEADRKVLEAKLDIEEKTLAKEQEKLVNNSKLVNDDLATKNSENQTGRETIATAQIDAYNNKSKEATKTTKSLGDAFKGAMSQMVLYSTSGGIMFGLADQVKEAVSYVKDLDTAQSNIMMITGRSKDEVSALTDKILELAKAQHIDYDEAMKGAEDLLRAGYSDEDTLSLTKTINIGSKVSGETPEELSAQIIALKNAYHMEADGINGVSGAMDKMTLLDNKTSTSVKELATALERTSASAQGVGVPFNNLLSYIGTVSDVTRKSASTIGENFRTIFGRYESVKGGKDFDPNNEAVNNVERDMQRYAQIAIRKDNGTFKDFDDVLDELHQKWSGLNEVSKSAITQALAGQHQRETLMTLMENWNKYTDDLDKVTGKTATVEGSAEKAKKAGADNSIEAQFTDLKNAKDDLYKSLIDTGTIKAFAEALKLIVEGLNGIVKITGGGWKGIIALGLAFTGVYKAFIVLLNLFSKATSIKTFLDLFEKFKGGEKVVEETEKVVSGVSKVTKAGEGIGVLTKGFELFGGALELLPALLDPVVLGIGAVILAGYGIYKLIDAMKQPAIKPIEPLKTQDTIDKEKVTNNRQVGTYANAKAEVPSSLDAGHKDIAVSADTKKAQDAFNTLEQKSKTSLLSIKANSTVITQQMATDMDSTYEKMGSQIKSELDKQYNERTSKLNAFITNSKTLTDKEKQDMLNSEEKGYKDKKDTIDKGLKQISDIYNTAVANHRGITEDESNQIKKIEGTFQTEQVTAVSKSAQEQEAILLNLKENQTTLTQQQASDVIKASAKQRDDTIKQANEQYEGIKADAEYQRDVAHTISADQAQKIIKEADTQRKGVIEKAQAQHESVVTEVRNQCGDIVDTIDEKSGEIFSAWQNIVKWFEENIIHPKIDTTGMGVDSKVGTENQNQVTKVDKINGQARALGGTADEGDALTGEEGSEIVISKDKRHYKVVGTHGAEVVAMAGGETVIPHRETEEILGKNSSSGSAYDYGTDNFPTGTRTQTTEYGGIIDGEGFFPNLYGEKPTAYELAKAKAQANKKTYNPDHFDFQSTVDVDKTELASDIRDIDNLTKAITNLDKLTKLYKDSKNFDDALATQTQSIGTLNEKLQSLGVGYQNTLNTKNTVGNKLLTEFTGLFSGKDLDAMTKPEMEQLYNNAYGKDQTGLSEEQKTAMTNQAKALKELTDDWFSAKDQLDSITQQELDTQTSLADAMKSKWDIIFSMQDKKVTDVNNQINTLKNQTNTLGDSDYSDKFENQRQIVELEKQRYKTLQSITQELQAQLDSGMLSANEWDYVNSKATDYKNTMYSALQDIKDSENALKSTITTLESNIDSLQSQIVQGYKNMYQNAQKAEIEPLQSDINNIQEQLEALDDDTISDNKTKLTRLQSELAMWQKDDSAYSKSKQLELEKEIKEATKTVKKDELTQQEKQDQTQINETNQRYEKLLDDDALYKQACDMINKGDAGEISSFLQKNLPEYYRNIEMFGDKYFEIIKKDTADSLIELKKLPTLLTEYKNGNYTGSASQDVNGGSSSNTTDTSGTSSTTDTSTSLPIVNATGANARILDAEYGTKIIIDPTYDKYKEATRVQTEAKWRAELASKGVYPTNPLQPAQMFTYKLGGESTTTGFHWLDGTTTEPERILDANSTKTFDNLVYNILPSLQKSSVANSNLPTLSSAVSTLLNVNQPLVKNDISITNNTPFDVDNNMDSLNKAIKQEMKQLGIKLSV
jgi:TP901 family phage tail tape measure protein